MKMNFYVNVVGSMDPCMFVINKQMQDGSIRRARMLAHVDDCDIAGDNAELLEGCRSQ